MTYSSGGPGYSGAPQSGAYAPTTQFAKVDDGNGPSKLPMYLLAGVAILGLAAYLLSFGPVWKSGDTGSAVVILGIISLLIAAVFAVVALLPKQTNRAALVGAAAVVGFLLAIWDLIKNANDAGWALIAIVVVAALQTVAAVAALLLDAGVITPPAPRPKYDPYQQYGGYYGQPQFGQSGQGPPSLGAPQGYPQYGGYPGGPSTGGFSPQQQHHGPPTPPTGFPTYAQPPSHGSAAEQKPQQEASTQSGPQQTPSPSGPPPS